MSIQQKNPASRIIDIEDFKNLYATFNLKTIEHLDKLYLQDVVFKDPLHQIQGIDSLKDYFAGFCNPTMDCKFTFKNQVVTKEQAFFQWNMQYSHPKLNKGKPLTLEGGTLIKFTYQIYYHEDFYDMGAMIYQHLPILGWAIKKINSRMVKI